MKRRNFLIVVRVLCYGFVTMLYVNCQNQTHVNSKTDFFLNLYSTVLILLVSDSSYIISWSIWIETMTTAAQKNKSAITLKGSAEIVCDYLSKLVSDLKCTLLNIAIFIYRLWY